MYEKITTHEQDAEDNFIFIFRKNSNVKDLIFGNRIQDLENVINDIYLSRFLDQATDKSLELIGERSGQPRPLSGEASTDDDMYRILIRAKIAANVSIGNFPDIAAVLEALECPYIYIRDLYPAGMLITYSDDLNLLSIAEIKALLVLAKTPVSLVVTRSHSSTPFGFAGNSRASGFDAGKLGG